MVLEVAAPAGAAGAEAVAAAAQSRHSITTGFRPALPRDRRPLTDDETEATEATEDLMPRNRFLLLVLPATRAPPLATEPGGVATATPLAWLCTAIIFIFATVAAPSTGMAVDDAACGCGEAKAASAGARPCSVTTTPPGGMGGGAPGHRGWKRLVGGGPPTDPGSLLRADATDAAPDCALAGATPATMAAAPLLLVSGWGDAVDPARDGGRLLAE